MRAAELPVTAENLAALEAAVAHANVPTLLPVLHQLTGDRTWLGERYRPTRCRGMDDNPTGELPDDVQAEIHAATVDAVGAWWAGRPLAVPAPTGDELSQLLAVAMGEPVPAEFTPMIAEELGATPAPLPTPSRDPAGLDVIIIGAGVSGLVLARDLAAAGIPHVVLERNDRVGGTWVNNPYPGCGVDTPSLLYSFSFYQRDWSQHFAKRAELAGYLADMARDEGLLPRIRLGVEVLDATWDDAGRCWTVTTAAGERLTARVVVSAVGQLSHPRIPPLAGLDEFTGPVFHSAHWPDGLDLAGKKVTVVGTGASAMQIVPAIVDEVGELTIVQRSPQWVAPSGDYFRPIPDGVHLLTRHVPMYHEWYRVRLGWIFNDKVHPSLTVDPDWPGRPHSINRVNDAHRRMFERYLRTELDGRDDLIAASLPHYPPFAKRMLLDNGWYRALRRPHVRLVTDEVTGLDAHHVHTAGGTAIEADVVVLATGFHAQRPTFPLVVRGRGGITLSEAWHGDDGRAYLGMTTPGFPNLLIMYGPNSNLGHGGSYMYLAERTARYVTDLLCRMVDEGLGAVEVRADVCADYVEAVDAAHRTMIWTQPGFTTWYTNSAGRVVTNMPWRVVDYWAMTRSAPLDAYDVR